MEKPMKPDTLSWTQSKKPGAMLWYNQPVISKESGVIMTVMYIKDPSSSATWSYEEYKMRKDSTSLSQDGKDHSSSSK